MNLGDLELQKKLVSALLDIGEKSTSDDLSAKLRSCLTGVSIVSWAIDNHARYSSVEVVSTGEGRILYNYVNIGSYITILTLDLI